MKTEPFLEEEVASGNNDAISDSTGCGEIHFEDDNKEIIDENSEDPLISLTQPSFCSSSYSLLKVEAERKHNEEGIDEPLPSSSSAQLMEQVTSSMSFLDEGDEEMYEIQRIIDEEEDVEVKDIKPVAIPIPVTSSSVVEIGNKKDIIISYGKSKIGKKQVLGLCAICNTGFPNTQLLQEHIATVHKDVKPFKCKHCKKAFATLAQKKVHETIHDPNRFKGAPKFACDMCDKKYHLKRSLEGHRKVQHLGYRKPKRRCNTIVRQPHSTAGVKNHRKPEKVLKIFKCPHCDLKYTMRCNLLKHMTVHTNERPYECTICGQRLSRKTSLNTHMKNRHINATEKTKTLPSFMKNQIWPCSICAKEFKTASRLQSHMTLHTGEKAHECPICKKRFRLPQLLQTHKKRAHPIMTAVAQTYHRFKCLLCGKNDMLIFSDLRNHRTNCISHRSIPYDSEKEKPFGCGICGKPYFLKINAVICALLRHDPASLQKAMFKIKCPVCPEERLGYHSALALKRHWDAEHSDLQFPVHFRAACGMYEKSLEFTRHDTLPSVALNKEAAKNIRNNGPPDVKYEFPLFQEFDLLQVDLNKKLKPRKPRKAVETNFKCEICGKTIVHFRNLRRHMEWHSKTKDRKIKIMQCKRFCCEVCQKKFNKLTMFQLHQKQHELRNAVGIKLPDEIPKSQLSWPYHCSICSKGFRKRNALQSHERLKHKIGVKSGRKPGRPKIAGNKQKLNKAVSFDSGIYDNNGIKRRVGRPRKLPLQIEENPSPFKPIEEVVQFNRVNVNDIAAIKLLLRNRYILIDLTF